MSSNFIPRWEHGLLSPVCCLHDCACLILQPAYLAQGEGL